MWAEGVSSDAEADVPSDCCARAPAARRNSGGRSVMPTQCIQLGTQRPREDKTDDHTANPRPRAHSRNLATPTERTTVLPCCSCSRHCCCPNARNTSCTCRKAGQECTNCVARCENRASENILTGNNATPSQRARRCSTRPSLGDRTPLATLTTPAQPEDNTARMRRGCTPRPAAEHTTLTPATLIVKGSIPPHMACHHARAGRSKSHPLSPPPLRAKWSRRRPPRPLLLRHPPTPPGGAGGDGGGSGFILPDWTREQRITLLHQRPEDWRPPAAVAAPRAAATPRTVVARLDPW